VHGLRDRKKPTPVVVIEKDEHNALLDRAHELGAIVIVGNGTHEGTLRSAAIGRARYLVAMTGDDGINAEIALQACSSVRDKRNGALVGIVHIDDPQLCDLLREHQMRAAEPSALRLWYFSIYERGARTLVELKMPMSVTQPGRVPHLLVIGVGRMGRCLIAAAARKWRELQPAGGSRMLVTLVDRAAAAKAELLRRQYPKFDATCKLKTVQIEVGSSEFISGTFLSDLKEGPTVTSVYVCLGNDSLGLSTALLLRGFMTENRVPVVVRMTDRSGLARLVNGNKSGLHGLGFLDTFPLHAETCTPELVLRDAQEVLGMALHERYVEQCHARGDTRERNPLLVVWSELPEEFRDSNRRQGASIETKLRAAGYEIRRLTDWDAPRHEFTPEEIEIMSRMEHERYVKEKTDAGWSYAPGDKNATLKTNPTLVSWDQLSDKEKDKDRTAVREIPRLLASIGLQVWRK
jgi:hypothetical protein